MRHKRKPQGSTRPAPPSGSASGLGGRPIKGVGRNGGNNGKGGQSDPPKGSSHEDRLARSRQQPDGPPPMPPVNRDRAHNDPLIGEALLGRGSAKRKRDSRFDRRRR